MHTVPIQTLNVQLGGAQHELTVLSLVDRRKRGSKRKQFCLVRAIEQLLYNVTQRSTGRFATHLSNMSMEDSVLVASRATVTEGILLESELDAGAQPYISCTQPHTQPDVHHTRHSPGRHAPTG